MPKYCVFYCIVYQGKWTNWFESWYNYGSQNTSRWIHTTTLLIAIAAILQQLRQWSWYIFWVIQAPSIALLTTVGYGSICFICLYSITNYQLSRDEFITFLHMLSTYNLSTVSEAEAGGSILVEIFYSYAVIKIISNIWRVKTFSYFDIIIINHIYILITCVTVCVFQLKYFFQILIATCL